MYRATPRFSLSRIMNFYILIVHEIERGQLRNIIVFLTAIDSIDSEESSPKIYRGKNTHRGMPLLKFELPIEWNIPWKRFSGHSFLLMNKILMT